MCNQMTMSGGSEVASRSLSISDFGVARKAAWYGCRVVVVNCSECWWSTILPERYHRTVLPTQLFSQNIQGLDVHSRSSYDQAMDPSHHFIPAANVVVVMSTQANQKLFIPESNDADYHRVQRQLKPFDATKIDLARIMWSGADRPREAIREK